MSWNDDVDRAFARRREELLQELLHDGMGVVDDLGAVASACAGKHPLAYLGSGLAAGAAMAMVRGSPSVDAPRQRSRLMRTALAMMRLLPLGA